jgi:hypothetical protein
MPFAEEESVWQTSPQGLVTQYLVSAMSRAAVFRVNPRRRNTVILQAVEEAKRFLCW